MSSDCAQRLRADVEDALHRDHVVPWHTHYGMAWVRCGCLQLPEEILQIGGRVLAVEQDPVESCAGDDFDGVAGGEAGPEADLRPGGLKGAFELVLG
jgi:hypothetical protein